jgi:Domain of unknown function (DU1801)
MRATVPAFSPEPVATYIASLPDGRREIVERIHEVVTKAVPELEVRMWKTFIGYGTYHYVYASGRDGEWFPIGLTNNKGYVSLYLCAGDEQGYLAESNADRLGKVSVGKSCIRVKRLEDVDLEVVAELSRRAADLVKSGKFAM